MAQPFALSMKVVICDKGGRCLVIQRSAASKNNTGNWDFPGGKVDHGERFDQALAREVLEETGLTVELTGLAGSAQSQAPGRIVIYLIMQGRLVGGDVRLSDEHSAFQWVKPSDLLAMNLCPQFRTFAEAYARHFTGHRAGTSLPLSLSEIYAGVEFASAAPAVASDDAR